MAAGLTIHEDDIGELRRRLAQYYRDSVKTAPIPTIRLDFEVIRPDLLRLENVEQLQKCEPFGSGFIPPCLCFKDAKLVSMKAVGGGAHCRMKVEKCGRRFDCIFFSATPQGLGVDVGHSIDIAFEPQVNEFRGWRNVQLHVLDVRKHEGAQSGT
jgi:single-stranded-DNA-specific exonuclease